MRNLSIISAILIVATCLPLSAAPKTGHYNAIDGKSGQDLFDAVHTVAKKNYKTLSYKGLWTAYLTTDLRSDKKIWDMYSDCEFEPTGKGIGKQCGNYSGECDCYNREHSIPQSWFGGGTDNNTPGTDIFHVVPTDGFTNSKRGSYVLGETSSGEAYGICKLGNSSFSGYSGTVWEPADEYKGDFARGYFGTLLRWAGDYQSFTTSPGNIIFSGNNTASGNFGLTTYGVNLLLKWHRQDPVSQKELDRNDGIEKTQGNRNPFIDYPQLAEYLWGNSKGQNVNLSTWKDAYGNGDNTSIEDIYGKDAIQSRAGALQITLPKAEFVTIYNLVGNMVYANETECATINLPQGLYIVNIKGMIKKIIVQ